MPLPSRTSLVRYSRLVALAFCIALGVALVIANLPSWQLEDADAYWNAANRLRSGQELYIPVVPSADETVAYRYAPWLAWLWVPLTYLPKPIVQLGWSVMLLAAVAVALAPLARSRSVPALCLLFLLGGFLLRTASTGNVHALVVAALVWGIPRRSGPMWVGLAASLKIAPVLYALVYLGRREWWKATTAIAIFAALWAPVLLYDLTGYPADPGESFSVLSLFGLIPWLVLNLLAAGCVLVVARGRYGWLAASTSALAAVPRLAFYDLTYLLVWQDGPDRMRGDAGTRDHRAIRVVRRRT